MVPIQRNLNSNSHGKQREPNFLSSKCLTQLGNLLCLDKVFKLLVAISVFECVRQSQYNIKQSDRTRIHQNLPESSHSLTDVLKYRNQTVSIVTYTRASQSRADRSSFFTSAAIYTIWKLVLTNQEDGKSYS